jgi:nucleoside-diphosphate-sugar epimerase
VIIHNAWKLDFNLSLFSFEPHIRGTRNLIDLALSGPDPSNTRFVFTSSVASVQGWDRSKGPVPEEVLKDARVAIGTGYGESKYVAERVRILYVGKGVNNVLK